MKDEEMKDEEYKKEDLEENLETGEVEEEIEEENIKDANINEEYDFKEEDSKDRDVTKSSKNETIANINFKWKTLVVVVLIISLTSGLLGSYIGIRMFASNYYPNSNNQQQITINPNDSYTTVSAVVQKSMSSVVGITTVEVKDHLFAQQLVNGIGSGIIVDSNGYILTNSHVISDGNAREINVLFENGEKAEAEVVWADSYMDLAIIKVNKKNLPVAVLGDSDSLVVGELAIAIGNPLGLEFQRTVTSGIISGLNRSVQVSENMVIDNLIQTDASINPGNSGGPLLNAKGEVIGINTAKISTAVGLGFAIPINTAKPIIEEVIKTGTYQKAYLGIKGVSVEEYEMGLGVDLEAESGAVILEVQDNSPAKRAGLQVGDIIIKLDDDVIENMHDLKNSLYSYRPNDKALLEIIRSGEIKKVEVILEASKQ